MNDSTKQDGFIVAQVLCYGSLQPIFRADDLLMFFTDKEQALNEISDTIKEVDEAIKEKHMDKDSRVGFGDYKIVPAQLEGETITCYDDGFTYTMQRQDEDWKLVYNNHK